jgi:hypothetical protein
MNYNTNESYKTPAIIAFSVLAILLGTVIFMPKQRQEPHQITSLITGSLISESHLYYGYRYEIKVTEYKTADFCSKEKLNFSLNENIQVLTEYRLISYCNYWAIDN